MSRRLDTDPPRFSRRTFITGGIVAIAGLGLAADILIHPKTAEAISSTNRFGIDIYGDGAPITDISGIVTQLNTEKANRDALYPSYQEPNTYNPLWIMTQATYNSLNAQVVAAGGMGNSFEEYLRDTFDVQMRNTIKSSAPSLLTSGTDTSPSGPKTGFDSRVILVVDPTALSTFQDADTGAMNGITSFDGILKIGGAEFSVPSAFDTTTQRNLKEYAFHGAMRLPEVHVGNVAPFDLSSAFKTLIGSGNVLYTGVQLQDRPHNTGSILYEAGTGTSIAPKDAEALVDRQASAHVYAKITPESYYLPYRVPSVIQLGFKDHTGVTDLSASADLSTLQIYWAQKTGTGNGKQIDVSGLRTLTNNVNINPDEIFPTGTGTRLTINGRQFIDPRENVGYVKITIGGVVRWGILTYDSIRTGFSKNIDRVNDTMPTTLKITIPTFANEIIPGTALNDDQKTDTYTVVGVPVSLPTNTPTNTPTHTETPTSTTTNTSTATGTPTPTNISTETPTVTITSTDTATSTVTPTDTTTNTPTATQTSTNTPTGTETATRTATPTPLPSVGGPGLGGPSFPSEPTRTNTPSHTPTGTSTPTSPTDSNRVIFPFIDQQLIRPRLRTK